jgi:hypothetical protein
MKEGTEKSLSSVPFQEIVCKFEFFCMIIFRIVQWLMVNVTSIKLIISTLRLPTYFGHPYRENPTILSNVIG